MAQRLTKRQLAAVAARVRRELESFMHLPDDEAVYRWRGPSDLSGLCMYGAIMVWQALRKKGRHPKIVAGEDHWFTHCDGHLIDVTASQFRQADIEVRPLRNGLPSGIGPGQGFWRPHRTSRTIKGVDAYFETHRRVIEEARRTKRRIGAK